MWLGMLISEWDERLAAQEVGGRGGIELERGRAAGEDRGNVRALCKAVTYMIYENPWPSLETRDLSTSSTVDVSAVSTSAAPVPAVVFDMGAWRRSGCGGDPGWPGRLGRGGVAAAKRPSPVPPDA